MATKLESGKLTLNDKIIDASGTSIVIPGTVQEGSSTVASGANSHVEGNLGECKGGNSHVEGHMGYCNGYSIHIEGSENKCYGPGGSGDNKVWNTHVGGYHNICTGTASLVTGSQNICNGDNQFVGGAWSNPAGGTTSGNNSKAYSEIIGDGSGESDRKNARTLDWAGNEWLRGHLTTTMIRPLMKSTTSGGYVSNNMNFVNVGYWGVAQNHGTNEETRMQWTISKICEAYPYETELYVIGSISSSGSFPFQGFIYNTSDLVDGLPKYCYFQMSRGFFGTGALYYYGTYDGKWSANSSVYGAVANDYSDSIEINEDCNLEPGYCYCFNGEKYYKSTKYLDEGIIGIHSDTYAMNVGQKGRCKEIDVAVSGFALAYVDKIYKPGTPLTCTKDGYLTEVSLQDKRDYPERIVGTFWKEEKEEIWEPETKNIKVNGRHWIKVS